ncbi:hypothetical protein GDO78_007162 [Eleutherodactylus coqui]|uniref:Uncharacterized protein n=1 Tax=Eleutherodactylus coqui TaxID=57060 RepID=A0A8J6FGV7_ELECQ|nr:hypothetical protein GDO78_007162 [Eleutherodactylus coqui]
MFCFPLSSFFQVYLYCCSFACYKSSSAPHMFIFSLRFSPNCFYHIPFLCYMISFCISSNCSSAISADSGVLALFPEFFHQFVSLSLSYIIYGFLIL